MDRNDVDKAILICARIDHNPHNNDYVSDCVKRYPDRIVQFADVDCSWMDSYHQPGAADRLEEAAEKYQLKGYTQYLSDDFGWFETSEGQKFIEKKVELKLIASLAFMHTWHEPLRAVARQYPELIIMGDSTTSGLTIPFGKHPSQLINFRAVINLGYRVPSPIGQRCVAEISRLRTGPKYRMRFRVYIQQIRRGQPALARH